MPHYTARHVWLTICCLMACGNGADPTFEGGAGPLPSAQHLLFRSDWSTATGTSDEAISDGGRWPSLVCPAHVRRLVLSVVPGSQVGWTATPNVLQVTNRGSAACGQVETRTEIPNGQSFYIRMYIRVENENQINFHPVDLNCCGQIQAPLWAIFDPVQGVDYNAKFSIPTPGDPSLSDWRPRGKLRQRVWYRFEWFVDFLDPDAMTARIWPRVFDLEGNQLYDAGSFVGMGQPNLTLRQHYERGGALRFTSLDLARRFAVGYEGNALARDLGGKWYYAGIEVRADDWPGPIR